MWLAFPIVNELFLIIKAKLCKQRVEKADYVAKYNLQ